MNKDKATINKDKKKKKNILFFLLLVLFIYTVVFFIDKDLAIASFNKALIIFIKIIPVFLLVFIIMFLSNLFLTPNIIKKHFGEEAGLKGWFYAIVFGIIVSGPPYALYPMLKEFKKQGLKNSYLATFLYNRNVKIPFIPVMIFYFGWQYTLVLSLFIIIFSIFNGLLVEKFTK